MLILIRDSYSAPLSADDKLYRAGSESEILPYHILEVTLVGEMEIIRIVAEKKESRRNIVRLGSIGDLETAAVEIRCLVIHLGLPDGGVEHLAGDLAMDDFIQFLHSRKDLVDVAAGLGGKEDDRRIAYRLHIVADLDSKIFYLFRSMFLQIPFVDDDDNGFVVFDGIVGDPDVLRDKS